MTDRLVACTTCSRHVKSSDAACPFCGAPLLRAAAPPRELFRRMSAAAAVAAGVTALSACDDTMVSVTPYYGAAGPSDGASVFTGDDAFTGPASTGPPSGVTFYGSPGIFEDSSLPQAERAADAAPDGSRDSGQASDAGTDGPPDGMTVDGSGPTDAAADGSSDT
jgi:hypothetical protein